MRRELKLSEQAAQKQLELFFDWYDYDFEEALEEAKQKGEEAPFLALRKVFIKAIRQGRLEIREEQADGESTLVLEQALDRKANDLVKLVYHEVTAGNHIAMRPAKNASEDARLFDFIAILTRTDISTLSKLKGADIKLAQSIGYLFLAV
jgi:hypothetical protein